LLPEVRGALPGPDELRDEPAPSQVQASAGAVVLPLRGRLRRHRLSQLVVELRYPLAMFAATRLLLVAVTLVNLPLQGATLHNEWRNWDGMWYLAISYHGYPSAILHYQTTLGFFPLYPLLVVGLAHVIGGAHVISGAIIALLTGLASTLLLERLTRRWWGEEAARRAVLFYCLFPGSIVFSMAYTEGLLLTLVMGCLLALEQRRWALAGLLAGLSTAVEPVSFAIVPACAVVAALELRRHGWRDPQARRALLAPLLAPLGAVAFGAYLWIHTGSPFATFIAQHDGWDEHSSPLALWFTFHHLFEEVIHLGPILHTGINLNYVAGLAGAAFLVWGCVRLWQARATVGAGVLVWTAGVALLTVTSEQTPPNPRMLICAFPAVLVLARNRTGRAFHQLIGWSAFLLVGMSLITYVGTGLRP
jgi:hypothetical protein